MNAEPTQAEVIEFLNKKLAAAQSSVKAREQAVESWANGTEDEWEQAARMSGTKPMSKKERLRVSETEGRILIKCRREVVMFTAAIAALGFASNEAPTEDPDAATPFLPGVDPISGTGVPSETPAVARVMPATESPTPAGVYDSLAAAGDSSPA